MAEDPTNERDDETRSGLRIVGAQSARLLAGTAAIEPSSVGLADGDDDDDAVDPTSEQLSWADMADGTGMIDLARPLDDDDDDDDVDDLDAFDDDGGWMEAGEQTLGDVLGRHSNGQPVVNAMSVDEPDGSHDDAEALDPDLLDPTIDAPREALPIVVGADDRDDGDDHDDDDVFPESMYRGSAARATFAPVLPGDLTTVGDQPVGSSSEPATLSRVTSDRRIAARVEDSDASDAPAAPARRKAAAPPNASDVADGEGWTTFAKSGPRWRDEARDWKDVDAMDQSMLADDASRVGTLNPDREEIADLYRFAEGDPRQASTPTTSAVKAPDAKEAKVVRIDALKSDPADPSAGPQQRRVGGPKRPTDTAKPAARGSVAPPSRSAGLPERIATGLVLALAVGFVFTIFETIGAAVLAGIAIIMAALELTNALRRRAFRPAIPVVALGLASVIAGGMFANARGVMVAIVLTVLATLMWFLFGVERERPTVNIAATLMAFLYPGIAAATAALMLDTKHGVGLITAAVACTVGHDVVAYFFGRFLGRRKLAPEISPNKTVEGLVGGIIGSVAVGGLLIGKLLSLTPWESVTRGVIVGLAVAIAAPLGDLVESQIKRDLDIKDMGTLLPGHGGVLDRIDGMLLAVPAVWLVATALQII